MGKYTFRDSFTERDSIYESDDGTIFKKEKELGHGVSARARKFVPGESGSSLPEAEQQKDKQEKAILKPVDPNNVNFKEVTDKYLFFKTIYPEFDVRLFLTQYTYRLVLPLIPGEPYKDIVGSNPDDVIKLFLSAVRAVKNCHNKGYVIVDLKADNICYDKNTGISYLIDGGHAIRTGKHISSLFQVASNQDANFMRNRYHHYAPECWFIRGRKAKTVNPEMDIYSLGKMMASMKCHVGSDEQKRLLSSVNGIIRQCVNYDSAKRPNLDQLENELLGLLSPDMQAQFNHTNEIDNANAHGDQEIQLIFQALDIEMDADKLRDIHNNVDLKNIILLFNAFCEKLQYPENSAQARALKTYKQETIQLILEGEDAFKEKYEQVKEKAINSIGDKWFTQVARLVGNVIMTAFATLSIVGLIAMAVTHEERGGFLLFQGDRKNFGKNFDNVEQPLENDGYLRPK